MRMYSNYIPTLRFKEFTNLWNEKKIHEILKIGSGKDYKHLGEGDVPVFGTGGLMTMVDDFLYNGQTVCIGRKGTIDKPMYFEGKIWTVDTLFYTHSFRESDPKFVYYLFQRINWKQYNEAGGVPSLSKSTIEQIDLITPLIEEQTKIASFLTAVDNKLQALKKKKELLEQYKKGMMQQLFSQEIRFKKDDGTNYPDWEWKKLSEVASRITRKNKENNLNVLTISAQFGLVSQLEYFNKSVSAKDVSGYYLIHKDEFAYNKSYSNGYPMGAIKRLNKYKKGVVSTLYICFSVNSEMVSCDFIEQYFETGLQNSEIEKFAQEGARNHGLLNIGVNDFFEIQLVLPCIEEQTKIANFLSAIDDKIAHCNSELDGLEQWKKGLLQQMFC